MSALVAKNNQHPVQIVQRVVAVPDRQNLAVRRIVARSKHAMCNPLVAVMLPAVAQNLHALLFVVTNSLKNKLINNKEFI